MREGVDCAIRFLSEKTAGKVKGKDWRGLTVLLAHEGVPLCGSARGRG
ncbi:hypothetical protein KCP76_13615 [Salmonella enterica subsp. enterica serovar Weltevreden]|nr:hypothetical protein KCP76_13615 [Salmonella enterica subsp. enterica serovar Weltevreden]